MSNVSEYLTQLQALTKKNLEILKALNQAFYTKSEHLSVVVDEESFIIPSYLALENRLNSLQDNFENLVNAPKTGEAAFDFNGNTQVIEMKGFSNTPARALSGVDRDQYAEFQVKKNQIFKDFCTPQPFIKIELTTLPTDIQEVNVKKVIPINKDLIALVREYLVETQSDTTINHISDSYKYSDLVKQLYGYEKEKDYIEYDTIYRLPVRDNTGTGTYRILNVVKNWTDNDLDEHYSLELDTVSYFTKEGTIQNTLAPGQYLTCNKDRCKLYIEDVKVSTKTIQVKVINGAYVDLVRFSDNAELGLLNFLPSQDWTNYKYINIPLEEDQFVLVFLAPINRGSLIQSDWGEGILFNTYNLSCEIDGVTYYYKDYYDKFVNNVGDTLTGITDMFDRSLVNFTEDQFNTITQYKPSIDKDRLKVLEINKHLSNSETVREIYGLYDQKVQTKTDLKDTQNEIDSINDLLGSISFADTTQNRTIYEQQLKSLEAKRDQLNSTLSSLINEISTAANDTDTPLDNPKYRIRGFFDYTTVNKEISTTNASVIGIDVQYRYKNANKSTGTATTISGKDIYSDWNQMDISLNKRRPTFEGVSTGFSYNYDKDTTNLNEISFNQIDIPIVQGETVDIRLRLIYNIGQPFIEVTSAWSDIINIEFPVDLKRNVSIIDVVNENIEDLKKNQFKGLMEEHGVISHTSDNLVDQNITYFHQPEHIASGFYTDERRVVPLADKLKEMEATIQSLEDEILGTEATNLQVSLVDSSHTTRLTPYSKTVHRVINYIDATKDVNGYTSETIDLEITNTSNHIVKLFSLFPGSSQKSLSNETKSRYPISDYVDVENKKAPWWGMINQVPGKCLFPQQNQIIYFRMNSIYDGTRFYSSANNAYQLNDVISDNTTVVLQPTPYGATMFPVYEKMSSSNTNSVISDLCVDTSSANACKVLQPGESIHVPIMFLYKLDDKHNFIQKTMSFDLRTSLYKDPINYVFTVSASYSGTTGDKLQKHIKKTKFSPVIVNTRSIQTPAEVSSMRKNRNR